MSGELRDWFEKAQAIAPNKRDEWLAQTVPLPLRESLAALLRASALSTPDDGERLREYLFETETDAPLWQPDGLIGQTIGGYRLQSILGSGGMSCVFLGTREGADFEQQVALKLLRHGIYTPLEQRLFQRERQILASLNHPNIARLIDGGVTAQGMPFLVMEWVDGETITRYCKSRSLDLRARMQLFQSLCQAVDAAHRQLIVHRDLKPANVLVSGDGSLKLLDFGIAKLIDSEEASTRTIGTLLTPEYAAPEQFEGARITPATDVYALGVILHELLLGERPGKSPITRPSQRSERLNTDPEFSTRRQLRQQLMGDIDNIVLKTLEQDPALRYRDAGDLADDVARYLEGREVRAHPPSRWYRTRKFIQRHRGAVGITTAMVLAVLASLAVALWQAHEAKQQAQRAQYAKQFVLDLFAAAKNELPESARPTPDVLVNIAARRLQHDRSIDPHTRADLLMMLATVSASADDFKQAQSLLDQAKTAVQSLDSKNLTLQFDLQQVELALQQQDLPSAERHLIPHLASHTREDADFVNIQTLLSQLRLHQGRIDEAIAAIDHAASAAEKAHAKEPKRVLMTALTAAQVRGISGRAKEAAPIYQSQLLRWKQLQLPEDADYFNALYNASTNAYNLGDLSRALALIKEAEPLARTIWTAPNHHIAVTLYSQSNFLNDQRRYDEALVAAKAALDMNLQLYAPEHPEVIDAARQHATIHAQQYGEAATIPLYRAVLKPCREVEGLRANRRCHLIRVDLGRALAEAGQFAESELLLNEAMELRRSIYGEHSYPHSQSLSSLAFLRMRQNRNADALSLLDRALALRESLGQAQDLGTGTVRLNRIIALYRLQRFDDGLQELERALPLWKGTTPAAEVVAFRESAWRALLLAGKGETLKAREQAARALSLKVLEQELPPSEWPALRALLD